MDITDKISQYFPFVPTPQQLAAFKKLLLFLSEVDNQHCFILRGYAGTGKTTMISTLVNMLSILNWRAVLLAPTGRAAKVMTAYSGKPAQTIHRKIYRKKIAGTPDLSFVLADNLHKNTLFIVDEASMISHESPGFHFKSLLEDLITYVEQGEQCRLLFVGDVAQLPPVGLTESPALNASYLHASYGYRVYDCELTEVVRQDQLSGVLYNATKIREQIRLGGLGKKIKFPRLNVQHYSDVYRMTGERLIEGLHYAYGKYGMENTLVICRSNKSANLYNQQIRNQVLFREEELTGGDQIMIVKNNYYWSAESERAQHFIANGDMGVVRRVRNVHEQHGFRFADISIDLLDQEEREPLQCRVLLDTLYTDSANLPAVQQKQLFESVMQDYIDFPNKRDRLDAMKKDVYYNALQIKFSMALTCHKAQGGQWDAVFVDQGYLTDEMLNIDFLRWLYTACTRATKELFFVNFGDSFFSKEK